MGDITALLRKARDENDSSAIDLIVGALYPDLHRMAQAQLAKNNTITLLDTTSMVHEAYERLRSAARIEADCRGQFMAYASQVMRSIVVDFVRKRRAERRGGGATHVTLSTDLLDAGGSSDDDVERVNDALGELASVDQRLKQVVEMRYFGGFAEQEIGEALGVSERTVRRDWERAKLLLQVAIRR
jgi:RNA polymerase sigma factor (TIGR02999 family)